MNIGGAKPNAEQLVSIIKSVDHGDKCSDFVFAFIHNLFLATLCQAVSCYMKLPQKDAAVTINNIDTDFSNLDDITADRKPELKNVIIESKTVISPSVVRQFVIYLCDIVEDVHIYDADATA